MINNCSNNGVSLIKKMHNLARTSKIQIFEVLIKPMIIPRTKPKRIPKVVICNVAITPSLNNGKYSGITPKFQGK